MASKATFFLFAGTSINASGLNIRYANDTASRGASLAGCGNTEISWVQLPNPMNAARAHHYLKDSGFAVGKHNEAAIVALLDKKIAADPMTAEQIAAFDETAVAAYEAEQAAKAAKKAAKTATKETELVVL